MNGPRLQCFLALVILALASRSARGALEPDLKKPYQLHIVLNVASNRFLTPLFQQELQRELGDQVRLALGPLAQVTVTKAHPLLREIEARGLEAALDRFEELSDRQTHFILLDYAAGDYRLQTRAFDGLTGQAGPLVRRTATSDRALVAERAARLIEQDFSPAGTITQAGKDVRLTLRGGGLGVAMDRWVKPGAVFAVSRITEEAGQLRATRLAWALLEVLEPPQEGVCRCRYWRRYQEDDLLEGPGTLGFRGLFLPTKTLPVRVRLIDEETFQPLDGAALHIVHAGTEKRVEVATNRDGLALTREPFANLALVRVVAGGQTRIQLPLPLFDDRTVVCRLKLQGESDAVQSAEYRRDAWLRRVYENLRLASERTLELNLVLNQSLEAALDKGRTGLKNLGEETTLLTRERDELHRLMLTLKAGPKRFDLREGEQGLGRLRERHKELQQFVERVESVLKEGGGETAVGLHKLLEQARLLESEAEFDRALVLYETVLKASPDQAKVKEHAATLKAAWALKNDRHAQAREFVYRVWPKLDVPGLQKNLEKAKDAVAVLRDAGDRLTPIRMQQANAGHAVNLTKLVETLRRRDTEDNRNQAKTVLQVAEGLRQLHGDVQTLVGRKE